MNNKNFLDKSWRMDNLYYINGKDGAVIPYKRNMYQTLFDANAHGRDIVLKSRQLWFTTHFVVSAFDDMVWNKNYKAMFIAHLKREADQILKNKLPTLWGNYKVRDLIDYQLQVDQAGEFRIWFDRKNPSVNSFIRAGTAGTSGTYQYMHISELAPMEEAEKWRADDVILGTAAVPYDWRIIIESTARGDFGTFHDMFMEAWDRTHSGRKLLPTEYKAHFFNWFNDPEIQLVKEMIPVSQMKNRELFEQTMRDNNLSLQQINWWYSKFAQFNYDLNKLFSEYPRCVDWDETVWDGHAFVKMKDVKINDFVIKHWKSWIKPVYKMTTQCWYTLSCTLEHKIKINETEFVDLWNLKVWDRVLLNKDVLLDDNDMQVVEISRMPFTQEFVKITTDLALFLWLFMWDGAFDWTKWEVSLAGHVDDWDLFDIYKNLIERLFWAKCAERWTSTKWYEIRFSRKDLINYFDRLWITRRGNHAIKRKVCVPDFIHKSPNHVVAKFLQWIFETDWFVNREWYWIKLFSRYEYFIKDIQMLLMRFWITSYFLKSVKKTKDKNGNIKEYVWYQISMRKEECNIFKEKIWFLSKRKIARQNVVKNIKYSANTKKIMQSDIIKSIEYEWEKETYDMETKSHEFIAWWIIVHNCIADAFRASGDPYFNQELIDMHPTFPPLAIEWPWKFYAKRDKTHQYSLGADPAWGNGGNNATIVIIDCTVGEVVAEYCNKFTSPEELWNLLNKYWILYNYWIVVPELNNHGHAVVLQLKHLKYPNIYSKIQDRTYSDQNSAELGFTTDGRTKPAILSQLSLAMNTFALRVPSEDIKKELWRYPRKESEIIMSDTDGNHWDRVIALALAWEWRKQLWLPSNWQLVVS